MAFKAAGPATDPSVIDRFDGGVGWVAHPDEGMARASHALAVDGDVWVIEPVDAAGVDDLLADYGTVAGVVVLLGRHSRDAAAVAARHDLPVHVPAWMSGVARALDAPVTRFSGELADTGYEVRRVVDYPGWREAALFDGETLLVPEALGTAVHFLAGDERLGVHPLLRFVPPRNSLSGLDPGRVLVGHGAGVLGDAAAALDDALAGARRRLPALYAGILRSFVSG